MYVVWFKYVVLCQSLATCPAVLLSTDGVAANTCDIGKDSPGHGAELDQLNSTL